MEALPIGPFGSVLGGMQSIVQTSSPAKIHWQKSLDVSKMVFAGHRSWVNLPNRQ